MTDKVALAGFLNALEEAGVVIDPDVASGGLRRTTKHLEEIEFKVVSPCGQVTVWLSVSGALREIIFAEGALKRHDHRQLAVLILRTIKAAEGLMREGIREYTRRQLAERRSS